jgi:hypothetical protein
MINTNNYFDSIKTLHVSKFPKELKFGYDFTKDVTENHTTWDYYNDDTELKASVDEYLANLSDYLKKQHTPQKKGTTKVVSEQSARKAAKDLIRSYVLRGDSLESLRSGQMGASTGEYQAMIRHNKIEVQEVNGIESDWKFSLPNIFNEILEESGMNKQKTPPSTPSKTKVVPKKRPSHTTPSPKQPMEKKTTARPKVPNQVERIDEEVKFIRRFVLLNNKEKTRAQVLSFINQLQKAIIERRIRKTSPYAKHIEFIQNNLLEFYKRMKNIGKLQMTDKVIDELQVIGGSEKVRLSINYMKRFVGIHGKQITKDKAKTLYNLISDALEKGKIKSNDPYIAKIHKVMASLEKFYKLAKRNETIEVHDAVLNGIDSALSGCGCGCFDCNKKSERKSKRKVNSLNGLSGIEENEKSIDVDNSIMNSTDFSEMKFDTIGFMGKWKEFIGDPSEGFTAMVYGKPKMGKSYFCIDWANYLSMNHGKVIYVSKEEYLSPTLALKLKDKNASNDNLDISGSLPDDLTPYQFIFLDSVTSMKLTPDDLKNLEDQYPDKSFIYVFQVTKNGSARGTNEFMHNVDVVIEIPEKGKAVQFGRFNQGGEMDIF